MRRLFGVLVVVASGVWLVACNSSRKVVGESHVEQRESHGDSCRVDSTLMVGSEVGNRREESGITADERGGVAIERDSAGRPVFIFWNHTVDLSAFTERGWEKDLWFHGLNATRRSEASGAMDSIDKKTEEVTEVVDTRISLDDIIGSGLMLLLAGCLVYLLFSDVILPWIRMKRQP